MTVESIVDAAAGERVIVFGSLPPEGRDLDLLVRPRAEAAIAAALEEHGFARRGSEWVRFADCSAIAVELVPAHEWGLPDPELADLFERAVPIDGCSNLAEPAPEHQLLILATRLVPGGKGMTAGRRARLERARASDPDAWQKAERRASAWGGPDALRTLTAALAPRPASRVAALRDGAWKLRHLRLVALSGIDGSGKSTNAKALKATLEQLGHETAIVWTPLASDAWLERFAAPLKRLLARVPSLRPQPSEPLTRPAGIVPNPGSELRGRIPVVNSLWATLVALSNGFAHARLGLGHALSGRIIIYDRYILDSIVRLRFLYGDRSRFRLQRAIIRLLSPPPTAAFFLDVDPAESLARKDDNWTSDELGTQARLYREEYSEAGSTRLDGTRPTDELCAEIAETVWRRLGPER